MTMTMVFHYGFLLLALLARTDWIMLCEYSWTNLFDVIHDQSEDWTLDPSRGVSVFSMDIDVMMVLFIDSGDSISGDCEEMVLYMVFHIDIAEH